MAHIFSFNEFVNESRGQRIGLRATNRPFDPNNNQWTQARDSRKERAVELRTKRKSGELEQLVEEFYIAGTAISDFNVKMMEDGISDKLFWGIELYFRSTEDIYTDNLCSIFLNDAHEMCVYNTSNYLKMLNPDFVECHSVDDLVKHFKVDTIDDNNDCIFAFSKLWFGDEAREPIDYDWVMEECCPMVRVMLNKDQCPRGFDKLLKSKGYEVESDVYVKKDNSTIDVLEFDVKLKDMPNFYNVLKGYISRY